MPERHRKQPALLAAVLVTAISMPGSVTAEDESNETPNDTPVRLDTRELLDLLVGEGLISREKADELLRRAAEQAQAARERAVEQAVEQDREGVSPDDVRVIHVPEPIKDEIRDEVRLELREDVARDVLGQAKQERWGVPGVLPEWTERFKLSGDIRVRHESIFYADKNSVSQQAFAYPDFNVVNADGGFDFASEDAFPNITTDRHRWRLRARLGVDARVTNSVKAGLRIATGSPDNPVSTNVTLGGDPGGFELKLDRAFLRFDPVDADGYPWMTLQAGRFANPWLYTDLVWDHDYNFSGVASTFRWNLAGADSLFAMEERNRTLFLTVGAFPLEEVERSSRDKWLLGAQIGADLVSDNQDRLRIGVAYLDYENITGIRNELDSTVNDFTAPEFVQKSNVLFDIRPPGDVNGQLFALASEYELLDLTVSYELARFAPTLLVITGNYVNNIGFDEDEVEARIGTDYVGGEEGYQLELAAGWPEVRDRRQWRASAAYRYLERDAVLDAFTDSDFHGGGTDAKGYILRGDYGIATNTWLTARWLSSDEIDGPPLGIDTLQIDLNARF